ncbi:hypothetical protein ACRAWG_11995 [Methylobacterium sp. P31]
MRSDVRPVRSTRKFGTFAVGRIAYGTYNVEIGQYRAASCSRGRFAIGGLIDYDSRAFRVQASVARDADTGAQDTDALGRVRDNDATNGWPRLIIRLSTPQAAHGRGAHRIEVQILPRVYASIGAERPGLNS